MMNRIFSATVCLTSSKSCFVTLSGDLAQRFESSVQDPVKVIIFKVEWQGGVAFVSWSGDVTVNRSVGLGQTQSSVVEIGRKFAELNGMQNSEQIVLTCVDRASTPSCTRIHVDPFSPDDWEILELHACFIETNLLNQVRVVWKGQVLPIWINKTTCIVVNIGETEPGTACVILEEFTEVIISPKQRNCVSSKKSEIPTTTLKKEQEESSHLHHAREKDTSKSQAKVIESSSSDGNVAMNPCTKNEGSKEGFSPRFLNWWNYFLHGEQEESYESLQDDFTNRNQNVNMEGKNNENSFECSEKRNCCVAAFERVELDLCLRNQMDVGLLQRLNNQEECRKKVGQDLEPFAVFVHPSTVAFNKLKCGKNHSVLYPDDYEGLKKVVIIRKVLSPKERVELFNISKRKSSKENETSLGNQGKKDVVTKQENSFSAAVVKMVLTKNVLPGHIAMHSHMQKQLGSLGMSRFLVNDATYEPQDVQGIILHPVRDALNKIEDLSHEVVLGSFIDWVSQTSSEKCPILLWDGVTVAFDCHGRSVEVILTILSHTQSRINPENTPYYNITPSTLKRVKVVMGEAKYTPKPIADLLQVQTENKTQLCCSINDLGGFDEPFHKCLKHLSVSLQQDPLSTLLSGGLSAGLANGAVLICGSGAHVGEGCGKTSLAHAVCQQLQHCPICAHVIIIDCIPLRAKRVETIQRYWQQAFMEATWYQPSVILLDNLDHVISAPSLAQEMGGEGFYRKRLVEVFKDLIATEAANNSSVAVIATSRSRSSLHTALQSGRGSHVFQCCIELGALNENQRMEILSILIKRKFQEAQQTELDTVLKNVVKKSEGFSPKDLSRLTDRAVHFSVVRKINKAKGSSHPSLILDDFNQALSGFIPASFQGIQLHKDSDLSWADVGGLHDVKNALKETLLWPSKYRKIFSKCPLRLRSGLLLYGPPGTGKTLLAGVVAKESGLNFISIKGPELLSKFIGASEQAVRDVFTRAQTAKPCILFFDEFDSLAPRRGHDSTGVTDRVVNQLLTQLDGVEGLEGVYILAATSRPGLIDPALLRPGRLDKCVYCPIPNKSERFEILLALTRHLPLADNVDLKSIADKCDNFTGADLKALLYNAQLESIHRSTSKLQLYGNILDTKDEIKQPDKTRENMTEVERHSSQIQDSVFAFSIGGGMKMLSREEEKAIENEITVLQKNRQALQTMELVDVKRKPDKQENVIYISQSDLDKAASTIRPSVTSKERLVYENIFDSFVKSRGGSFTKNLPIEEKATLA